MKIIDVPQAGKIGLQVAMPGRYGQVRRAWVVPANPRTAAQLEVRRILTQNTQAFRALSTAQQDAWNAAAASVQTRSSLGQSGPMTGAQFFTRINCNLQALGQEHVDVPPARRSATSPRPASSSPTPAASSPSSSPAPRIPARTRSSARRSRSVPRPAPSRAPA